MNKTILGIFALIGSQILFFIFLNKQFNFFNLTSYLEKGNICKDCNVIIISMDVLRYDHLGIYGYPRNTSPNIDNFFKNSIIFKNNISQSSITLPSHMSMFTSLYPQEHGVMMLGSPKLKDSVKTIAQVLKDQGYKTVGIYSASQYVSPDYGFDRGFDKYLLKNSPKTIFHEVNELLTQDKPFFLSIYPYNPHDPYTVLTETSVKFTDPNYSGNIDSNPQNYPQEIRSDYRKYHNLFWSKVNAKDPSDIKHLLDLYDAKIYSSDLELKNLFDMLDQSNKLDKTIIFFVSDHGEEFFEHGKNTHMQLYDEVIKVPFFIRLPRQKEKITINELTQTVDIAPTVYDFLGIKTNIKLSGKSLMPLINNQHAKINEFTISQWSNITAIRSLDWKLIFNSGLEEKLYDLKNDPVEKKNLITEFPEVTQLLRKQIIGVLKEIQYEFDKGPYYERLDKEKRERLIKEGYF